MSEVPLYLTMVTIWPGLALSGVVFTKTYDYKGFVTNPARDSTNLTTPHLKYAPFSPRVGQGDLLWKQS